MWLSGKHLPGVYKALGLLPGTSITTGKKKKKEKRREERMQSLFG
jgi:hypothetical protein